MKKRVKRALTIIVSLLCVAVTVTSYYVKKITQRVEATSNTVFVGTLFEIQHVYQTTKVYVMGPMLQLAQSAGRTIYAEVNSPLGDAPLSDGVPYVFMDDGYYSGTRDFHPPVRYYYYATVYEPILTGSNDMYNDYDSLVVALEYLESEALFFSETDIKNTVLSYVRGINSDYRTHTMSAFGININYYQVVCGDVCSSFINAEKQIVPGGMKINEFFAAFLQDSSQYDSSLYGSCDSSFLSMQLELADPVSSNQSIDLIHLFASLDGIFEGTGESTGSLPYNLLAQNTYRHLVSWAGDLQCATSICSQDGITISSFDVIFASSHYEFCYADFYADTDAINIALGTQLVNVSSISEAIDNYYSDLENNYINRLTSFATKIAQTYSGTDPLTTDEKFESIVREMLGVDSNGDSIISMLNPAHYAKYHFLGLSTGTSYRNNMAERFVEYVLD